MRTKHSLLFLMLVPVFLTCCKKDENEVDLGKLTDRTWHPYKQKFGTGNELYMQSCSFDDIWTFHEGGLLDIDTRATYCNALVDTNQYLYYSWQLNTAQDSIMWWNSSTPFLSKWKIMKLTKSEMLLKQTADSTDVNGVSYGKRDFLWWFIVD